MNRQAKPVAGVIDVQNGCHILVGEALGRTELGRLCVDGCDNIKMFHEVVGIYDGVCWIEQALDRNRWRTFVKYAVKRVHRQRGIS
jgi:hypothetical protein